jgi:hypothetical protein
VNALSVQLEHVNAQFTRDNKVLTVLQEKIRDVNRSKSCGTIDMAKMLRAAKMKYLDTRQLIEQKWKATHAVGRQKLHRRDSVAADFSMTVATPLKKHLRVKLNPIEAVDAERTPPAISKNRSFSQTVPLARIIKPHSKKSPNMLSPTLSTQELL